MADSGVRELAANRAPDPISTTPTQPLIRQESRQTPAPAPWNGAASRTRAPSIPRQAAVIAAPIMTFAISLGLAIAPLAAAIVALWAIGKALITLTQLITLARAGQALTSPTTPELLNSLDIAARAGFLAIGYLALIFALIALMAGLFGRGWGRLFILPGAAFSATALALLGIGAVFAPPLVHLLPVPAAWLIPLAMYALVDAVLVSSVLVDVRPTRSPSATGHHRAAPRPPRSAGATPA